MRLHRRTFLRPRSCRFSIEDRTGAVVVAGMEYVAGEVKQNEARIYAPRVAVRSYDKERLLPHFENIFTPVYLADLFRSSRL